MQDADFAGDPMHGDAKNHGPERPWNGAIRTPCATHGACREAVRRRRVVAATAIDPRSATLRPRDDIVRRSRLKPHWPNRETFAQSRRPSEPRASATLMPVLAKVPFVGRFVGVAKSMAMSAP